MKTTIQIDVHPFEVPDFVRMEIPPIPRDNGMLFYPPIPLSDLDPHTLNKLCDDFRTEVFKKAGKPQPPTAACAHGKGYTEYCEPCGRTHVLK